MKKRKENGEKIIMDFAVEHISKEMELDKDNNMIIYDEPEARMIYVTDMNDLPGIVYEAAKKNSLEKTMILPVRDISDKDFSYDDVCTDACDFYASGIPIVSMISTPMYLFHNSDDIDKVHQDSLEPVGNMYLGLVYEVWNSLTY